MLPPIDMETNWSTILYMCSIYCCDICLSSYWKGSDSKGECGVPYERRFPMPRPSLDQPWYDIASEIHVQHEDVSLLEGGPHSEGGMYRLQWSWDLKMCPY